MRGGRRLRPGRGSRGPEPVEGGVDVNGVPQHDAIEDQAERPELVFHAVVVALVKFSLPAVEDFLRQGVAAFLEVADAFDVAPVGPTSSSMTASTCSDLNIRP